MLPAGLFVPLPGLAYVASGVLVAGMHDYIRLVQEELRTALRRKGRASRDCVCGRRGTFLDGGDTEGGDRDAPQDPRKAWGKFRIVHGGAPNSGRSGCWNASVMLHGHVPA